MGLEALDDPQRHHQEQRADGGDPEQTHAGRESDGERGQHHDRVLRVLDLRAIANQVRGAGDAERARQALADDQHDQRADNGQHDLRLDDRGIAPGRRGAARPEGERGAEQRGDRQAHGGISESGAEIAEQFIRLQHLLLRRRRRRRCRRSGALAAASEPRARPVLQTRSAATAIARQPASTTSGHSCPSVEALTLDRSARPS